MEVVAALWVFLYLVCVVVGVSQWVTSKEGFGMFILNNIILFVFFALVGGAAMLLHTMMTRMVL